MGWRETRRGSFPTLRSIQTHPNHSRVVVCLPEAQKLFQITIALNLLPRDGAVNRDVMSGNVLQDPFIRRRRTPHIVLGGQAVDRDHELQPAKIAPFGRDRTYGARFDLGVNIALVELRQDGRQLAIANERLAADDEDVQRFAIVDELDESTYQLLALVVGESAQRCGAAEAVVAVGVTPGATHRP